ncbi:orotidine-5'-phosphate decarboxylase [Bifidobacterium sp. ESL0763]|uniref:orotidine-5'-phosphate decarboxylase n=1 Tax=Bifidobacterium sp. ESL0763 TaxID=2983227 RepID=UPI0023F9C90E|nr:orotidine-5'-phosphate decarboxylase [Bifidobacterium sp. ESL0763]MDF7663863.1 orotidine-5'-phosphate decarboxylase [Bifidobacterium sp. ESL0763]
MDRLIEAIEAKDNPSVVGLDPTPTLVPPQAITSQDGFGGPKAQEDGTHGMERSGEAPAAQIVTGFYGFNRAIIDAVKDIVPAVKPQIAMYEAYGSVGFDVYRLTCQYAQSQGLYVLGDIKRGDIGSTAAAYAKHLTGVNTLDGDINGHPWHEDAITVNPYFGTDGMTPFLNAAKQADKDLFALVRTSNPSSAEIQELELASGERVYEHVADLVEVWGVDSIGKYGYSRLGAVVGATHPEQGKKLRERMPHTFFLVPGYGAQGGTAADVAGMFGAHGRGAIVNSSRGIIGAWKKSGKYRETMDAQEALDLVGRSARAAAIAMRDDLREALRRP